MKRKFYFLLLLISSYISLNEAHAYLDPGSGNAIISLLLSLAVAFVYYAKSFFYKLASIITGKNVKLDRDERIAIFSEGKNYWLTYKPIIEELISQKIPFIYYSMDIHDPALTIDNEFMHSKYIGSNNRAYAKVGALKTNILLTTTPNIGCPEYPLRRPAKVGKLCHVWHSISDSSVYHLGALDHYDVALTVGDWVETPLRQIEKIRKLNKKEIISVGLPYFDELKKNHDNQISLHKADSNSKKENKVLLVAPSWGTKNCLRVYGTDFIKQALDQGYAVIYRPHPQSIKVENDFVKNVCTQFKSFKNFSFDSNPDATESMMKSDMMISDKSGVRFDYAFLYEKPVLTLDFSTDLLDEYEAVLLGRVWGEAESALIGIHLQPNDKEKIMDSIKQTLEFKGNEIINLREKVLNNYGKSASSVVSWFKKEMNLTDNQ
ncbi:MAG: hypothetical protein E7273_15140 [Pseudobutyrivibrio ruminis]|nr:hypothetical protein [Pseudobutyrivibrio ruminis]